MKQYSLTLLVALPILVTPGCSFDRERPEPTEPRVPAQLSVEVVEPRDGVTVIAGRDLIVRVSARDLGGTGLEGVGYVVRRLGSTSNTTLDSAAVSFADSSEATREFAFVVPATLPSSTQLDVFGIAFGPNTQARLSNPRSVTVTQCQPGC
jgi:hypothetical protein